MTQDPEPEALHTKVARPSSSPFSELADRVRDWASRRLPSHIDSSMLKNAREYHRSTDPEKILESIPSTDDSVALKSICAAEFYTPAHAEQLMQAFEKMGWGSEETSPFRRDSAKWVARSRRGAAGGWINLGSIVDPANSNYGAHTARVELPKGFGRADAKLYSISSSLSCIVIDFKTLPATESAYEVTAHQKIGTELRKTRRGFSIISPKSRKTELINSARESFREDIFAWFTKNLPGAFSTKGNLELFPTCELLFLNNVRSQVTDGNVNRGLWIDYLGLGQRFGEWACKEISGLTFSHLVSHRRDQREHTALSIERSDLQMMDNTVFGGHSDEAYLNRLGFGFPALICHWSIDALLRLYKEEQSAVRDGRFGANKVAETTEVLQSLQTVNSNSVDVSLLAAELPTALSPNHLIWTEWDFRSSTTDAGEPISLHNSLNDRALQAIKQLASSDEIIRDFLMQQGNLINALEAVATQRSMSKLTTIMTWLTVAIFILTAGMAYIAFIPARNSMEATAVKSGDE